MSHCVITDRLFGERSGEIDQITGTDFGLLPPYHTLYNKKIIMSLEFRTQIKGGDIQSKQNEKGKLRFK